jgi:hypothetical protein
MPNGWPNTKPERSIITANEWNAVVNGMQVWPGNCNANNKLLFNLGNVTFADGSLLVTTTTPLSGDVTGPMGATVLAPSGVAAGVYTKVTVDAKGRVTVGAAIAAGDLPDLSAIYAPIGHNHNTLYVPLARTVTAGTGLTGGGALSANISLAVAPDTTVQRHEIAKAAALIGTRPRLNLIEGANVTLTVADDAANNRVNVTVASTGGGAGSQTPWASNIDGAGFQLNQVSKVGISSGLTAIGQLIAGGLGQVRLETLPGVSLTVYGKTFLKVGSDDYIAFETTLPAVERMRITAAGNVLIGTATDDGANKLQLYGNLKIGGALLPTLEFRGGSDTGSGRIISGLGSTAGAFYLTGNASFNGSVWNRDDIAAGAGAIAIPPQTTTEGVNGQLRAVAPGANPFAWTTCLAWSVTKVSINLPLIHTLPVAASDADLPNNALRCHLISNTQLAFRVRGADGTMRQAILTLA